MKEKATGQIQQIQDDLKRSGLPAAAFAMLPAIVAVFGVAGLPAFGVAALSYLATNRAAAKKMLEFQEFVYSGLKG
ncbi:MAG: hypothetical protein KDC10_17215, partial [Calditrichaeota bacterium]|nr:hypothetical protein [Calditrichota bacterium]